MILSSNDEATEASKENGSFHNLILSRRTILQFEPNLPPNWQSVLRQAIEAAIYAPNHRRTEPWRFYLLGPEAIRAICELNYQIILAKSGEKAAEKKRKRWESMPGWLVVTCRKHSVTDSLEDPKGLPREDYAACCCAIQNLCLSLHSNGLGTKWSTGGVNFHQDFPSLVGFSSEEEYAMGTIWFGTPSSIPLPPMKKLGIDKVLHHSS